jgi:hypothetical protein
MSGFYDSSSIAKRIQSLFATNEFIYDVVNTITAVRGKRMLDNEVHGLISFKNALDPNLFKKNTRKEIVDLVAKNFAAKLTHRTGVGIDTHELMKRHIGAIKHDKKESIFHDTECAPFAPTMSLTNPDALQMTEQFTTRARNSDETNAAYDADITADELTAMRMRASKIPFQLENAAMPFSSALDKYPRIKKQKVQNLYLTFDSYYRSLSTDNSTFSWTVSNSLNTTQGSVNTLVDQIHNIVNVQFDQFRIPYTETADNVYQKISLFIEEFDSMAIVQGNGSRYHMMFDSEIQTNRLLLTPLVNDEGRFRFHTPINILNTITFKFRSPFSPVVFLPDRYNVVITSTSNTTSTLTFSEAHNVTDTERIHITEFDTLAPIADNERITEINKEIGHIVKSINDTQLTIEVPLDTITADPNNIAKCFIASRRIIITTRFEYLV